MQWLKYLLVRSILVLFMPSLTAAPQDEILVIEELIQTTKKNLDSQQGLLDGLLEFKEAREAFLANPESGKLATALVRRAMQVHKQLEKEHLSHLFSTEFLTELAFYNQIGKQYGRS